MWTPLDFVALAALGLVGGWFGGLMGVGGAVIIIPGLVIFFGPDRQHLYQAAAMMVNVFVVAPSVRQHLRAGAILKPIVRHTIPASCVGSLLGVYVSDRRVFQESGQGWLQLIFATFLGYVICYNLLRLRQRNRLADIDEAAAALIPRWKLVLLIGLPTGFVGGLLGVAGGVMAVPAQQVLLRMPLPRAVANSAATILLPSLIGALVKNSGLDRHGFTWAQSLQLAAILMPTAFCGGLLGAWLVHRWPRWLIRVLFVVFVGYSTGRMALAGWRNVHTGPGTPSTTPATEPARTRRPIINSSPEEPPRASANRGIERARIDPLAEPRPARVENVCWTTAPDDP